MNLIRRLREAPVTVGLIAVNLLVYLIMVAVSRRIVSFDNGTMIGAGALVSGGDIETSHWRWLTAAFVHVGLLHIFMNVWVLAQIGVISERALGRGLFVATYVVTGILGNVLSSAHAAGSPVPRISAGASGAGFACACDLVASWAAWRLRSRVETISGSSSPGSPR